MKSNWKWQNTPYRVAIAFAEMYPTLKLSTHLNQFVYYEKEGDLKWRVDVDKTLLKTIINGDFKKRLELFFEKSKQEYKENANIVIERKNKVSKFLNSPKNIDLLIKFIAKMSIIDGKFNKNSNLLLFKNVIYHLKKNRIIKKGYPNYWLLDNLEMNIDFEDKNCKKIEFIEEKLINIIFPDEETRKCYFKCLSKLFSCSKKKKIILNINGDANSLFMNILFDIFGTYGIKIKYEELKKKNMIEFQKEIDQKRIIFIQLEKTTEKLLKKLFKQMECLNDEITINGIIMINCNEIDESINYNSNIQERLLIYRFPNKKSITIAESCDVRKITKEFGAQIFHILLKYYDENIGNK